MQVLVVSFHPLPIFSLARFASAHIGPVPVLAFLGFLERGGMRSRHAGPSLLSWTVVLKLPVPTGPALAVAVTRPDQGGASCHVPLGRLPWAKAFRHGQRATLVSLKGNLLRQHDIACDEVIARYKAPTTQHLARVVNLIDVHAGAT
jgi:hypothetical protein